MRTQVFLRSPLGIFGVMVVTATLLALLLVPGLVRALFAPGAFMPHVHCYLDDPRMVWLQGSSDFLIGFSYMLISGALAYLVYKARHDIPFGWMFLAFGLFIFTCGWTHFLEVWTLWNPTYWLSGAVKAVTALVSLATAAGIFYLIPHVFRLIHTAKVSELRRYELARTHEQLQRAYADLETFSYSLSHDIRGPLRAVNSFSAILIEDHARTLAPDAAEIVQKIAASAERLDRLVNDVLTLSRLSRVEFTTESVNLEHVLDMILRDRPELQAPNVKLEVRRPLLPVLGDVASLTQCLENLLGNAVKFVAPGVKPHIAIFTQALNGSVRICIKDNGIGIPAEARERIFLPFARLHTQKEYAGTGIGLAIVQKAVERMRGSLGVESQPGAGSCFWVELPSGTPSSGAHKVSNRN